jgi:hypothetical protein
LLEILDMTHRMPKLALLVTLPLLGLGCSAVEGEENAGRGMRSMMKLLGAGAPAAALEAATAGRPNDFRAFGLDGSASINVDVDIPCPSGGKMKLDGSLSLDSQLGTVEGWDAYADVAVEFDLGVKFRRCKVDGVKLGGELDYSLTFDVDTTAGTASLDWSYVGDVTFRGDVEGRCTIDMHASASSGDAFSNLDVRAYAGSMCGFDAEEVSVYAELESTF